MATASVVNAALLRPRTASERRRVTTQCSHWQDAPLRHASAKLSCAARRLRSGALGELRGLPVQELAARLQGCNGSDGELHLLITGKR